MYGIKKLRAGIEEALKKRTQGSYWTRTKWFKRLCKWAFKTCDTNLTGKLTKGELYTGLLLVYIKIARYAGPAACYPPSREIVDILFDASHSNESEDIDEDEFVMIMVVLFSQLTWRILSFYLLIITLVPYIIMSTLRILHNFGVDETFLRIDSVISAYAPFPINKIVDLVPDSVWIKLPESIVSCLVLSFALPYCWNKMDEYLEEVVDKNTTETRNENMEVTKMD